jgi:hypothetical protein
LEIWISVDALMGLHRRSLSPNFIGQCFRSIDVR